MVLRNMTGSEPLYVFTQSQQLNQQTGFVGYLRGDFGQSGKQFWTSWFCNREDWNTPEFKHDLQRSVDRLRYETDQLADLDHVAELCRGEGATAITEDKHWFGFRVDSEKYAYLLKCSPYKGDNNFYVYCFQKDWLDQHILKAQQGIRFIDPEYNEQFRIPDGSKIRITRADGTQNELCCRYIDESHMELMDGRDSVYHICQFAEIMERNGSRVEPIGATLGEQKITHPDKPVFEQTIG